MELSQIERALRRGSRSEPVYRPVAVAELLRDHGGGAARGRAWVLPLVGAAGVAVVALVVGVVLLRPAAPSGPGSAPGGADRLCGADDLQARLADVRDLGARRALDIELLRSGTGACLLARSSQVVIHEQRNDETTRIPGNSDHHVERWPRLPGFVVVPEGSVVRGVVEWHNYCGARPDGSLAVRVGIGGRTAGEQSAAWLEVAYPLMADSTPPACMADEWGSRVTPFVVATVDGRAPQTIAAEPDPLAGVPACRRDELGPEDPVVGTVATGEIEVIIVRVAGVRCIVPSSWRAVIRDASGAMLADSGPPDASTWHGAIAGGGERHVGVVRIRWTNHCGVDPVWPLQLELSVGGEPLRSVRVAPDIDAAPACLDDALPPYVVTLFLGT